MKINEFKLGKNLIYFQIIYNCFIKFFIGHFHVPGTANYLTDIITLIIFVLFIKRNHLSIKKNWTNLLLLSFVCITFIGFIFNGYSVLLYIWGARNIFRFFVFFAGCICFFEENDIQKLFAILEKICWANIVLALIQRYVLHYYGDGSSGFYSLGNVSGGNGSINILFCVVLCYQLSMYMVQQQKIKRIILTIIGMIAVAASIELKYFFVELFIITIVFFTIQRAKTKNLVIVICIMVGFFVGIDYLSKLYPEWDNFFTIESIIANGQYYGAKEKIGRISGIGYILNNYLTYNWQKFLGIGLGNADFSTSYAFLTSNFYRQHSFLGYEYIQSAWLVLENGILGLAIYIMWLIEPFRIAWKQREEKSCYNYMGMFFSVIAVLQLFYNQMLRVETSGYLMSLCLAVVFIHINKNRELNNGKNRKIY